MPARALPSASPARDRRRRKRTLGFIHPKDRAAVEPYKRRDGSAAGSDELPVLGARAEALRVLLPVGRGHDVLLVRQLAAREAVDESPVPGLVGVPAAVEAVSRRSWREKGAGGRAARRVRCRCPAEGGRRRTASSPGSGARCRCGPSATSPKASCASASARCRPRCRLSLRRHSRERVSQRCFLWAARGRGCAWHGWQKAAKRSQSQPAGEAGAAKRRSSGLLFRT